jgi:hypothetical protein
MSLNVLVIPEDFRKDQYILKPVVEAIFNAAGKPNANVRVCQNPLLGGTGQALDRDRILGIVKKYSMVDLFILCVDRDVSPTRRKTLDDIEQWVQTNVGKPLLGENAWQEIEVWLLAGMSDLPAMWTWADVRSEVGLKEQYYVPYAAQRGLDRLPDQGRKKLGQETAGQYTRMRSKCPEDIQVLESRVREHVERLRMP